MPSSNRPPEEQARVKEFNPLVLDRTVIALPLLKDMQEDLELIAKVKAAHPEVFSKFNTAIEFDQDFPGGAEGGERGSSKWPTRPRKLRSKPQRSGSKALAKKRKPSRRSGMTLSKRQSPGKPSSHCNRKTPIVSPGCTPR